MFLVKNNSALETKSPCAINMVLRNDCQLAFLMLFFYRRDDDSYSHSKETESVDNSAGTFSLKLSFHACLFPTPFWSPSDHHRQLLMDIMCFVH